MTAQRLLRHVSQLLPALLALALLAFTLRSADLGRSLALVKSLGWKIPLLLLPTLVATLCETFGWWVAFGRLGQRPRFRPLLAVRMMTDAVMLALPSGAVISESLQPYLLKRRCGVPFEIGIIAGLGRKFLVVLSHGLFLGLSVLLAWPMLHRASQATIGRLGLPLLLLAAAAVLVVVAGGSVALGVHGKLADRVRRVLNRFGGRRLGTWLERNALRFQAADEHLVRFFTQRPAGLIVPAAAYLGAWLARAIETLVFLRLLGVNIALISAMVIETSLILVRAMAVPVPAGLGVQDAGYVLSLKVLGVADAVTVGAAFVLLKRGKDLFWIAFGFLLLALGRDRVGDSAEPAASPKESPGGPSEGSSGGTSEGSPGG
jgi:uncharacterized protein (TIRG00374 family)